MFAEGTRVGNLLYYPVGQEVLTPLSLRVAYGGGQEGACHSGARGARRLRDRRRLSGIDSFGLRLPFRAVQ